MLGMWRVSRHLPGGSVPHNLFAPKIENSVEDLNDLVYGKLHRLYGENPPELFVKRVETELHDIIPSSIFPSIRVFSNESVPCIRWPKYWNFSFSISPPMNIQD